MVDRREASGTKITAELVGDNWVATFEGPIGDEIAQRWGTNVLPTAWNGLADADYVLAELVRLNPGAVVSVVVR